MFDALGAVGASAANLGFNVAQNYMTGRQNAAFSWGLYKKQRKLDYEYDSNQYYNLSRRYAENSAKWQMQGLKNAGINPMLAAINGNIGTFGPGSSSGSLPSVSGSAGNTDVAANLSSIMGSSNSKANATTTNALRDSLVSSAKSDAQNKEAQIDVTKATARQIDAQTDNMRANTALTAQRTINEERNQGFDSPYGNVQNLFRSARDFINNRYNNSSSSNDIKPKSTTNSKSTTRHNPSFPQPYSYGYWDNLTVPTGDSTPHSAKKSVHDKNIYFGSRRSRPHK